MASAANNPKQVRSQSGQWNVQVVRGRVTTKCLWNACKALSIGLFLMTVGAAMAIVGYYADQLSMRNEIRGNSTVRVKNESCGFHLNNLSYAGPIIMGIGGFIVVAACVMTFEARDSAAKVVPARFKPSTDSSIQLNSAKSTPHTLRSLQRLDSKMNMGCQTPMNKDNFKLSSLGSGDKSPTNDPFGRKMLTSAFVQFSRALMENHSGEGRRVGMRANLSEANLSKSPSAPDLYVDERLAIPAAQRATQDEASRRLMMKGSPNPGQRTNPEREPIRNVDRCTLLSPQLLQRQALSMDNPFYDSCDCCIPPSPSLCRQCSHKSEGSPDSIHMELGASAGVSGSQASMALDLHDCQVTLKVKDESQNRRSDMSRRHQLLRQRPVDDEKESCRCSCTSRLVHTNTSDDSAIERIPGSDAHRIRCQSLKSIQKNQVLVPGQRIPAFSRSRSCTDENSRAELERKIYCIEEHKKRKFPSAERLKQRECPADQSWNSDRSPCRTTNGPVRWRAESSGCAIHGDTSPSQAFARKNAKRGRSSQKSEGSISDDAACQGRQGNCRTPTARSAAASPTRRSATTRNSCSSLNRDENDQVTRK